MSHLGSWRCYKYRHLTPISTSSDVRCTPWECRQKKSRYGPPVWVSVVKQGYQLDCVQISNTRQICVAGSDRFPYDTDVRDCWKTQATVWWHWCETKDNMWCGWCMLWCGGQSWCKKAASGQCRRFRIQSLCAGQASHKRVVLGFQICLNPDLFESWQLQGFVSDSTLIKAVTPDFATPFPPHLVTQRLEGWGVHHTTLVSEGMQGAVMNRCVDHNCSPDTASLRLSLVWSST